MSQKARPKLILIVDDDEQIRKLVRKIVKRPGYDIREAANGIEALAQYDAQKPELVIMDIVMPEMEGIETIMALRRQDPSLKIIAISGGGRLPPQGYLKMAQKAGAMHTIKKPLQKDILLDIVEQALAA